jgi:hypothetical protein
VSGLPRFGVSSRLPTADSRLPIPDQLHPYFPLSILYSLLLLLTKIIPLLKAGHNNPLLPATTLTVSIRQQAETVTNKLLVMKKWILFLFSSWIVNAGFAQAWTKKYDHVDECICGLSLVGKDKKHGFVDKNGKLIVPLIYDEALTFSEGMAAVMQNFKWGYIDSTGKTIVELQYNEAMSFHDGLAVVV